MAKFRCIAVAALLISTLAPALVQAQSGSIPYTEGNLLHIPRIDVEGYGSLEVDLVLVDAANLVYALQAANTTTATFAPSATFDLDTNILSIPLLQADGEFFSVNLILQDGTNFQVTSSDEATLVGQDEYNTQCASCHGTDGQGAAVAVSMVNCANCSSIDTLSNYIANVMPLGAPDTCTGTCASDVATYIDTVFQVDNSPMVQQTISAIQSMPLDETLRKASLQLVSRLPTETESNLVETQGEAGLLSVLDSMMTEEAFYDRVAEIFNDLILTDRYLTINGTPGEALNLMRGVFPDAFWFGDPQTTEIDAEYISNLFITNDSVAREPLELVNFVVENELPMTEILTADYFMVNPYSAKSYGVFDELNFQNEYDADEWLPAQLEDVEFTTRQGNTISLGDIPHAGLFTSLMFLNRYPTSDTNRNRGRSRVVYDLFLDVDILALEGSRPDGEAVDISSPAPTLDNDDCVVCHGLLDPVASSFENWTENGFYIPQLPWYDDMFQAGFAGVDRPDSEEPQSLQWLAGEIAKDPRFNDAMVRIAYFGLVGREPLDPPGEDGTTAEWDAYNAESVHLDELKAAFAADNQNLKTLIKEIVLSPYWRAEGLEDESFAIIHEDTGAARLLSPEMLHRKIGALLGFEWRGMLDFYYLTKNMDNQARLLDDRQFYQQIYGGIDSFVVTQRLTEPNGLMVYVQERMANELACYAVPNDFLAPAGERLLLPFVEPNMQPVGLSNQNAIMNNIQYLHSHLLAEDLDIGDPELQTTYELFTSVWQAGESAVNVTETVELPPLCQRSRDLETGANLAEPLINDPDYVIRSWMAVTAYLMSDYRFVYE
ncbi:MAG: c-type cytochrome [Gammaproteobacteria bacterium]